MAPVLRTSTSHTVSRFLSVLAILSASGAVTVLLLPNPLADVFFAGIVMLSVLFAVIGGIGAWTNRTPLVWVAAFLSTGLSLLGMMSIGVFLVPATLFLFGAAVFSHLAGPRTDVREAIVANPPPEREIVRKKLVGIASAVVGGGLVYGGAFAQDLFGACARETVACALETTNWGAAGLTVLGSTAVSFGGWLLWKQAYLRRVLASTETQ